jgi:glycosyltransferase involved in cell wall biosynthesis
MHSKPRIAIVISHPIQHFCPQYASLAKLDSIQLKVFFASALGYKKYIDADFNKEISWGNLQLDQFDHVFLNGDKVLPANKSLDAPALDAALDAFDPDIVIVHGYFQQFQRRAFRWARRNKIKIAYISDSERRHKRNPVKEWIKYPFIYRYFSRISYFLSVGNANEDFYTHYGVSTRKLIRMHFSIDTAYYKKSYNNKTGLRKDIREQHGIGADEIVLTTVGKLVPWKNQGDIIDAMQLLEQQGTCLHLFIIGSGEMQSSLEQKASALKHSKIYFKGFVNIEALPAYYAAADIYVHAASVEPHSLAISEAVYMGSPVIISDRCGSYGETDDVQEDKNGYTFPFGNIKDLAEKIGALGADKKKRERFSSYSHQAAVEFQRRSHGGFIDELVARSPA